jgi:ribose/xylose/arabinose/galactoside ABC-type transport system permease subunit
VGIITLGQNLEIDVIAMVIIGGTAMAGGKGNSWGTFIGVLLLGSISNAMAILRMPSAWQFVAKGVIIIASVSLAASSGGMSLYLNRLKAKFIRN